MEKDTKSRLFNGITRNILLLGFISMFTDISSQMIFPLLPLFLVNVLGANASIVGIVEGAAETTASLLKVFSGYFSDKIKKRKPFVFLGYFLSTITKPLFFIATSWYFIVIARMIERIGKGVRDAPRDAIVAESTKKEVRGKVYGFHRAMDGLGAVLGATIAFFLFPILGYRNIFLFAFIPALIGTLLILFLKEAKALKVGNKNMTKEKKEKIGIFRSFKMLPRNLKLFIFVSAVFALGDFGYAFLLLKSKSIGLLENYSILLYILFYLVYLFCTIPAGILSDKIGRKPVIIIGYFIFGITSLGLILTSNLLLLTIFFIMYGIFFAMVDGVQRAFVVDLAPKNLKATALGTFHTAIGLVALPGGFIAGFLWDSFGSGATFFYALCIAAVSLVLFTQIKNNKSPQKK